AAGAGDRQGLRDAAKVAIALSVGFGVVMVVLFLSFPVAIISLFLDESKPQSAEIIAFGVTLLAMAALFQMADAMQVMALGLLRAIKDTRVPMIAATVSYWVIGIPTGYYLAFHAGMGGIGLWLGLVIGLVFAAVTMMWRFWHRVQNVA
ncbi:MATE family efflux transporter, partial [Cypionkella sp.]